MGETLLNGIDMCMRSDQLMAWTESYPVGTQHGINVDLMLKLSI